MPCLVVTMPKMDASAKRELSHRLTQALVESTGFDREIFGIHFTEYGANEVASGGELWDGSRAGPYVHLVLYCPRLTRVVKTRLVEALSRPFTRGPGYSSCQIIVHICEHPYDNIGLDGKLLSDSYPECAQKSFYYELSDK